MNEITSGLRSVELHERQDRLRKLAEREMLGAVTEGKTRRFRRTVRRAQ